LTESAAVAAAMVPEIVTVTEFGGIAESFTVTPKLYGPAAVGVPLIVDEAAAGVADSPAGNWAAEKVYAPTPPDAEQVVEYATPTAAGPAAGAQFSVSAVAGEAIVPVKVAVTEVGAVAESCTITAKLYDPPAVGVPLMVNEFVGGPAESPAGSGPPVSEIVYPPTPPDAVQVV
jgi:hypothetical protein